MLQIGELKVFGPDEPRLPRTHQEARRWLRAIAQDLGLDLKFQANMSGGYCSPLEAKAIVGLCYGGSQRKALRQRVSIRRLIHMALHEIAHWIQYNEGFFSACAPQKRYGLYVRDIEAVRRLIVRYEKHADFLSEKLAVEFFGEPMGIELSYENTQEARRFLYDRYSLGSR